MASLWTVQRHEIDATIGRAERLAQVLRGRAHDLAICHGDLHPGNLLLGADGALAIVDWDQPILAPKEHDLMAVGAGLGFVRETSQEEALFYRGYGPAAVDLVALSYYRYERVAADLAAYGEQIFEAQGSVEDREQGLAQLAAQFRPGNVVPVAHRTYERLDDATL
jgi:spectinomycin phosphotransferase